MIDLIPEEKADAVVGDVSTTVGRMAEADFTMPFTESGWSMVVAVQAQTATGMFFFLKPLTPSLWLASLAAFIFTGFVIWVIEHRINPEFPEARRCSSSASSSTMPSPPSSSHTVS